MKGIWLAIASIALLASGCIYEIISLNANNICENRCRSLVMVVLSDVFIILALLIHARKNRNGLSLSVFICVITVDILIISSGILCK